MAKRLEIHHIKIPNWEKWNEVGKTKSWFKFSSNFFEDHKIRQLNFREQILYIFLLSHCATKGTPEVSLLASMIASVVPHRGTRVTSSLSKLSELGLIILQKERKNRKKERKVDKKISTPENQTKHTDIFNEVWEHWPSNGDKGSKSQARKNFEKFIEVNSVEFAMTCVENYKSFVEKEKPKFYYRLSNFFGQKAYWESFQKKKQKKKTGTDEFFDMFGGDDV